MHDFSIAALPQTTAFPAYPTAEEIHAAMHEASALIRQKQFAAAERTYWRAYHPLLMGDRSTDMRNHFLNEGKGLILKAQDKTRDLLVAMGELYEDTARPLEAACCYRKAISPDIYDAYAWEKHHKIATTYNLSDDEEDWNRLLEKSAIRAEPRQSGQPAIIVATQEPLAPAA